ncbi:MAG TPA: AI-2E family transporter [Candidatus Nanoarchaeia archaeon]|nr:AI-2E family transporter [Candidatus Nanoarchaeia archaeon]
MKEKLRLYERLFFIGILLTILVLVFLIIKPFLASLLTAAIISYLTYPLFLKTLKYIKKKTLAAFLFTLLIILALSIPVTIAIAMVSREAFATYQNLNTQNLGSNFLQIACKSPDSLTCRNLMGLVKILPNSDPDYYLQSVIGKITSYIIDNGYRFIASLPSIILQLFVMFTIIFYLLKDGEEISKRIKEILPFKEKQKAHLFEKFHSITYAVFYGNISVAIIQGVIGAAGFAIFGVKSAFLWGIVMTIFALIPYFGTAIIWLPAALNLIFTGYLSDQNFLIFKGIGLMVYGAIFISSIDNIIRPKIIGDKANVHPILVLLGVLGGLGLFGFVGFIIGPIILSLLVVFIDIYEEEKNGELS